MLPTRHAGTVSRVVHRLIPGTHGPFTALAARSGLYSLCERWLGDRVEDAAGNYPIIGGNHVGYVPEGEGISGLEVEDVGRADPRIRARKHHELHRPMSLPRSVHTYTTRHCDRQLYMVTVVCYLGILAFG